MTALSYTPYSSGLGALLQTPDRIQAVALDILEREGADAVSMRRVAQALQLTPMAIYHHFRNREALLQLVVHRQFAAFEEAMRLAPGRGSHEARLLHCAEAYAQFAFDRPRVFDFIFSQPRPGARRYPRDFRARRSPTLNRLADAVSAGMDAGVWERADVWEIAVEIWAHVHGYLALYRAGRFALSKREFLRLMRRSLRRLIHGLKPR